MPPVQKSESQGEPWTVRIHNVVKSYQCDKNGEAGYSVVKEFLANAEDARASEFCVVYDARQHACPELDKSPMKGLSHWQGPSLLFYNDSKFSDEDWENFKTAGTSEKLGKGLIGRFGLGALTG